MVLLHWCTLVPEGESRLAAIRFTAPIRISFIRVFPTGSRPFAHSPEVVAATEPKTFFLDIFFNAHPTSAEFKEKQRAANALVPTSIAYAGGEVDFSVDMGPEYATRLMILKGEFDSISIAIYGEIVSEAPSEIPPYEPKPLPAVNARPLSRAVDPASMLDPAHLAKQLLSLIPDSPPLALIIRLMFCLKPSNEDWELPEFPYLHADLDVETDNIFDLDIALAKPVRDDISYESLSAFATKVAESVGPKSINQAYLVAKLLCVSAPQHPDMARTLLQQVDLEAVFDSQTMDESTLLRLLDAVSNADIARYLNGSWFFAELDKIQANTTVEKYSKSIAARISARIRRWEAFEDVLSNSVGNFQEAVEMLRDVGREEQSIGIWLETMLNHPNLVAKLADNAASTEPRIHLPQLFASVQPLHTTHDDLISFIRAFIGVACVLAVWAWTDSLGNDECRAQTLAIVRLWQNVDGYREILTRRLEWMTTDNTDPRKSGVLAEQILANLAQEPQPILCDDLVRTILTLEPPLSFIAEHERLSMRKVALVADDGLPAAVEELTFSSSHPLSLRRLRTIRVSLAIIQQELEDGDSDEWRILEALWDEGAHGFVERLVDVFMGVADDLNAHFAVAVAPLPMNQALVGQLFRTSEDILRLIANLSPALVLMSRTLRNLISSVADVFVCTAAAAVLYSQPDSAALDLRQTCLDVVRRFSQSDLYVEPRRLGAEVVLRFLLDRAGEAGGHDPATHFLQVFALIDHVLPHTAQTEDDPWVMTVLPTVLPEFGSFFHLLDPRNKIHMINRVVKLDGGVVGIGEWLLLEELKDLSQILESIKDSTASRELELTRHHQVFLILQFLRDLVDASSDTAEWCMFAISSVVGISQSLAQCLVILLDMHLVSPILHDLTRILAARADAFESELKFALVLSSLRAFQHEPLVLLNVLKELPHESNEHHKEMLRLEIGQTLSAVAHSEVTDKMAQTVLSILIWLVNQGTPKMSTLCGILTSSLAQLYNKLGDALPRTSIAALRSVKDAIQVDEDDAMIPPSVELPSSLGLSWADIESLLHPLASPPSTPKVTSITPDILGVMSSPTGLLRSPAATGLTKTYANNDFRLLRQAPSARLNTSRLPSMHVDDFELASVSPVLEPGSFQNQVLFPFNTL
ncbi:hypothetical protein R3P38DRAFT_2833730 [Favolaschia claudopus]|uniref:Virilizer N-terminal domain-containing protein n=1 Tax=Favolaschia claudopus TaxID=2862362 RepID=A0AAW0EAQ5_9AGAR